MKKSILGTVILIAVLLINFVSLWLWLQNDGGRDYSYYDSDEYLSKKARSYRIVDAGRPEVALKFPDFSKEITDIRITVKERDFEPYVNEDYFENLTMLQIYYGYYSDGEWHDIPCENYDLKGIFESDVTDGWKAAEKSHMVQIGPYILFSITYPTKSSFNYKIYDSLETEVLEPLSEYATYTYYFDDEGEAHSYFEDHSHGYGYFYEDNEGVLNGKTEFDIVSHFDRRFYVVVDYSALSNDYKLHFDDVFYQYVITKSDIDELLGK